MAVARKRIAAPPRPDIVIATIGPLGADLSRVTAILSDTIKTTGYEPHVIRPSELLHDFRRWKRLPSNPVDVQIERHQRAGNELRQKTRDNAAMALLGIAEIQRLRRQQRRSSRATAFVIRSLKRKAEVESLRSIYGASLFVIAAHAPISFRVDTLARQISESRGSQNVSSFLDLARHLIDRDAAELDESFGQDLRSAFPLADAIVDASDGAKLEEQISRLIRIMFSAPFETPTRPEFAMVHAKAAALRSADLGRQVGAAIVNESGDVIAVGKTEGQEARVGIDWCRSARGHDSAMEGKHGEAANEELTSEFEISRIGPGSDQKLEERDREASAPSARAGQAGARRIRARTAGLSPGTAEG